jgi:hypothetical protein
MAIALEIHPMMPVQKVVKRVVALAASYRSVSVWTGIDIENCLY